MAIHKYWDFSILSAKTCQQVYKTLHDKPITDGFRILCEGAAALGQRTFAGKSVSDGSTQTDVTFRPG